MCVGCNVLLLTTLEALQTWWLMRFIAIPKYLSHLPVIVVHKSTNQLAFPLVTHSEGVKRLNLVLPEHAPTDTEYWHR